MKRNVTSCSTSPSRASAASSSTSRVLGASSADRDREQRQPGGELGMRARRAPHAGAAQHGLARRRSSQCRSEQLAQRVAPGGVRRPPACSCRRSSRARTRISRASASPRASASTRGACRCRSPPDELRPAPPRPCARGICDRLLPATPARGRARSAAARAAGAGDGGARNARRPTSKEGAVDGAALALDRKRRDARCASKFQPAARLENRLRSRTHRRATAPSRTGAQQKLTTSPMHGVGATVQGGPTSPVKTWPRLTPMRTGSRVPASTMWRIARSMRSSSSPTTRGARGA